MDIVNEFYTPMEIQIIPDIELMEICDDEDYTFYFENINDNMEIEIIDDFYETFELNKNNSFEKEFYNMINEENEEN